jgi:hypothetical protein
MMIDDMNFVATNINNEAPSINHVLGASEWWLGWKNGGWKIRSENWNWKLELKIGIENWNWKLELKIGIENWNWKLELKIGIEIGQI